MAEKKPNPEKSKIQIQTRKPEKRGIFDNIGNNREKNDHPLREILNFPDPQISESQEPQLWLSSLDSTGNPANQTLDSQNKFTENPNQEKLDSQNIIPGNPSKNTSAIRSIFTGDPNLKILDSKISKQTSRLSKNETNLDSKISENKNLDIQNTEKKHNWQKYEKTRKSKGVFLRTNDEITKKFKQFCIGQDWEFSEGTEIAWSRLMDDLAIQNIDSLDSLIAQDDRRLKMLYKTKPLIINLYLRYTAAFNEISQGSGKNWNAKWLPRDDNAAYKYNDLEPSIVELGILQTQIQKGFGSSRIQTFKYYIDEIEKVLNSGVTDEMLETILNYHRQIWKNQTGKDVDLSFLENNKVN